MGFHEVDSLQVHDQLVERKGYVGIFLAINGFEVLELGRLEPWYGNLCGKELCFYTLV